MIKTDSLLYGSKVAILGGVNIDIAGFPHEKLIMEDDVPGRMNYSMGGVGRNIAENLVRLGIKANLISVIGGDTHGKSIIEHSAEIGIYLDDSLIVDDQISSVQMAIMDESNDLAIAISAMDIYDEMDVDFIKSKMGIIEKSSLVVIETNIPESVIKYVLENVTDQKFCLDPVSCAKAERVKNLLNHFYIIKVNLLEAEVLIGWKIQNDDDYKKAADFFHLKGIRKVFLTLGSKGVYFSDSDSQGLLEPLNVDVKSTHGSGDAFMAGVVYAELENLPIDQASEFAMACAAITVSHQDTVNPNMSLSAVLNL